MAYHGTLCSRGCARRAAKVMRMKQLMSTPATAIQITEAELSCCRHSYIRSAACISMNAAPISCKTDCTPPERVPARFFLQLLPSADQRRRQSRNSSRLLEDLTVNETSFFRNKAQLELFHKHVLEEMIRTKQERAITSLRIWAPGCSTGQEPYTIGHAGGGRTGVLPTANPAPQRHSDAQAVDSPAMASGNSGQRYQLFGPARGAGRHVQRTSNGFGGLQLPPALFRQGRRPLCGKKAVKEWSTSISTI